MEVRLRDGRDGAGLGGDGGLRCSGSERLTTKIVSSLAPTVTLYEYQVQAQGALWYWGAGIDAAVRQLEREWGAVAQARPLIGAFGGGARNVIALSALDGVLESPSTYRLG